MKVLMSILCVCFGLAASSMFKAAAPLVDDSVLAFVEGISETGSLRDAVRMPYAYELDKVEEDLKKELANLVRESLDELFENLKIRLENGKNVAEELSEKVERYKKELKELVNDIGEKDNELLKQTKIKVKEQGKELLRKLLKRLGIDKRNLEQEFDVIARSKLSELLQKIKSEIINKETHQKICEYIKNLETENPVIEVVKEFLLDLKEVDYKQLIHDLFQYRRDSQSVKDFWKQFKEWLKNSEVNIKKMTEQFQEWVKVTMDEGIIKMKEKHNMIKSLAMEAIAHTKDKNIEVAMEALEFFRKYKEDLGSLWNQLVEVIKQHVGSF